MGHIPKHVRDLSFFCNRSDLNNRDMKRKTICGVYPPTADTAHAPKCPANPPDPLSLLLLIPPAQRAGLGSGLGCHRDFGCHTNSSGLGCHPHLGCYPPLRNSDVTLNIRERAVVVILSKRLKQLLKYTRRGYSPEIRVLWAHRPMTLICRSLMSLFCLYLVTISQ